MIPTFSPGVEGYARCIRAGFPFSLTRYGEGEWRVIVPEMYVKKQRVYSEWHAEEAQNALRFTLLEYHREMNYCPAIWHQRYYARDGRDEKIEGWLSRHDLTDIPWHDGRVWRRAIENDNFYHIVSAIRECPLPLVFVGPHTIHNIVDRKFDVAKFVPVHPTHAYYDRWSTAETILLLKEPSLISFSVGGTTNILIHALFPHIGHHSLMIDFGATWEVLAGKNRRVRPYAKKLTWQRIQKNWEGK